MESCISRDNAGHEPGRARRHSSESSKERTYIRDDLEQYNHHHKTMIYMYISRLWKLPITPNMCFPRHVYETTKRGLTVVSSYDTHRGITMEASVRADAESQVSACKALVQSCHPQFPSKAVKSAHPKLSSKMLIHSSHPKLSSTIPIQSSHTQSPCKAHAKLPF
jgi:hypothetical protein